MHYRTFGAGGVKVSALAIGAGPVPGLMVGSDRERQLAVLRRAMEVGINWIDTAATYGNGASEASLGEALADLGAADRFHLATKVRLTDEAFVDIEAFVRASVERSLDRLRVGRVALLQLHNSITRRRGDEPTSVTPEDVLGTGGVVDAFEKLRREGKAVHLGLTALGAPAALKEVLCSGRLDAIQVPFGLANPTAAFAPSAGFEESDHGGIVPFAANLGMGVFAIRVFAGGALVGAPPSPHTHTTRFFPLDLYRRDERRAERIAAALAGRMTIREAAIRFSAGQPGVTSAIIGFSEPGHIDEAARAIEKGPLPLGIVSSLLKAVFERAGANQGTAASEPLRGAHGG